MNISEKNVTSGLCYRPHPKDGGRYCFQFVCQFTPRRGGGGGTMVGGVPRPSLDGGGGGSPARSGWWEGYPGQVLMVGGTPARSGWWGYPGQVLTVVGVPWPGLDGGGEGLPWVPSTRS